jgi:hypothetical protein
MSEQSERNGHCVPEAELGKRSLGRVIRLIKVIIERRKISFRK